VIADIGDRVRLGAVIRDEAAVATNATVVVTVKKPDGTTTTPAVTNPSTGSYGAVVDIDMPGPWSVRWVATGTLKAAEELTFQVRRSVVL